MVGQCQEHPWAAVAHPHLQSAVAVASRDGQCQELGHGHVGEGLADKAEPRLEPGSGGSRGSGADACGVCGSGWAGASTASQACSAPDSWPQKAASRWNALAPVQVSFLFRCLVAGGDDLVVVLLVLFSLSDFAAQLIPRRLRSRTGTTWPTTQIPGVAWTKHLLITSAMTQLYGSHWRDSDSHSSWAELK